MGTDTPGGAAVCALTLRSCAGCTSADAARSPPGRERGARRAGRAAAGSARFLERVPWEHVSLRCADGPLGCRWAVSPGLVCSAP